MAVTLTLSADGALSTPSAVPYPAPGNQTPDNPTTETTREGSPVKEITNAEKSTQEKTTFQTSNAVNSSAESHSRVDPPTLGVSTAASAHVNPALNIPTIEISPAQEIHIPELHNSNKVKAEIPNSDKAMTEISNAYNSKTEIPTASINMEEKASSSSSSSLTSSLSSSPLSSPATRRRIRWRLDSKNDDILDFSTDSTPAPKSAFEKLFGRKRANVSSKPTKSILKIKGYKSVEPSVDDDPDIVKHPSVTCFKEMKPSSTAQNKSPYQSLLQLATPNKTNTSEKSIPPAAPKLQRKHEASFAQSEAAQSEAAQSEAAQSKAAQSEAPQSEAPQSGADKQFEKMSSKNQPQNEKASQQKPIAVVKPTEQNPISSQPSEQSYATFLKRFRQNVPHDIPDNQSEQKQVPSIPASYSEQPRDPSIPEKPTQPHFTQHSSMKPQKTNIVPLSLEELAKPLYPEEMTQETERAQDIASIQQPLPHEMNHNPNAKSDELLFYGNHKPKDIWGTQSFISVKDLAGSVSSNDVDDEEYGHVSRRQRDRHACNPQRPLHPQLSDSPHSSRSSSPALSSFNQQQPALEHNAPNIPHARNHNVPQHHDFAGTSSYNRENQTSKIDPVREQRQKPKFASSADIYKMLNSYKRPTSDKSAHK